MHINREFMLIRYEIKQIICDYVNVLKWKRMAINKTKGKI